ncbi:hypothetical protein CN918_32040 [Priestia megaterium]|nr:hypothetical protein CN918_32040 [Priestia megaterium]
MKQRRREKVEQEIDVIEMVACNCCGSIFKGTEWLYKTHEIKLDLSRNTIHSNHKAWEFDLCEPCIFTYMQTFVHPPVELLSSTSELGSNSTNVVTDLLDIDSQLLINGYSEKEIDDIAQMNEKKRQLSILNSFPVISIGANDVVLIDQTNEVCFYLEKLKPINWEQYLIEHGDGEYLNIAPLAYEFGGLWNNLHKKFCLKKKD